MARVASRKNGIKAFVCKEMNCSSVEVDVKKDASLIGGFVIAVEGKEYDFSLKKKMQSIKAQIMRTAKESTGDNKAVLEALRKDIKSFKQTHGSPHRKRPEKHPCRSGRRRPRIFRP